MTAAKVALLDVRDLRTYFGRKDQPVRAVDGVSFTVGQGETVALVGESGSGKSVTALSLARLLPAAQAYHAGGQIVFGGRDVLAMGDAELRALRGADIAYVFQEPGSSLNPVFTIGYQIAEAVRLHRPDVDARKETLEWLGRVGIPEPKQRFDSYPHQFSGGMQQRVMIAMALACRPKLLVADEPTTALDVTIQAQILKLLASLQHELNMAMLLITHNLALVAENADRVYVMRAGVIVESGPTEQILRRPEHPYTQALLAAVPRLRGAKS
jgi:ABC-type dipeptide/oligopeptide/nickel transport system ATPase component